MSTRPFGTPVAGIELVTSHVFETTAQQDGVLSVTAMFAPLGTIFLGAPGDCYGLGGQAHARIELFMKVRVTIPDRRPIDLPVGETLTILDQAITAGCDGESRFISVGTVGGESYQVINADLTSVATGDTIRVAAGFALYLSTALHGSVSAHFSTRPSGLNVPVVLVKIAS